ncbi:hypothetical protein A3F03_03230 [Candidatus Roizmanbacteria bacterium RIFCSPHIGHO2_12_FULL_41_11]|uniref:Uncharacterized protein n=2 Tax=Candidatus Roizmaniibacteriota TaxID=1752723 RepID=A0A1F7JAS9_9BACT|nr:MAG: hypothetical protein A3F03_03230 [Candidatus Roizmanbacteria bacterium RIFCSPHIGHO2_12_FULL_41_11]OGK52696.1 MAG: hypothetical protein A2966_02555 [Candidatus Roizmanbacteria bacterium RIFCSPLOWO2_01_FULL_41_22]
MERILKNDFRNEVIHPVNELVKMRPIVGCAKTHPEEFWDKYRGTIAYHFNGLLQRNDTTDVEIVTPVHHNSGDLPLLLYTLSRQVVPPNNSLAFTVLLHNADAESTHIVHELEVATEGRVRVVDIRNPLLHGAYYGWQFANQITTGKKMNSLPLKDWRELVIQHAYEKLPLPKSDNLHRRAETYRLVNHIAKYTPWSKEIITCYINGQQVTKREAYLAFREYAQQREYDYPEICDIFDLEPITTNEELLHTLNAIGYHCIKQVMEQILRDI